MSSQFESVACRAVPTDHHHHGREQAQPDQAPSGVDRRAAERIGPDRGQRPTRRRLQRRAVIGPQRTVGPLVQHPTQYRDRQGSEDSPGARIERDWSPAPQQHHRDADEDSGEGGRQRGSGHVGGLTPARADPFSPADLPSVRRPFQFAVPTPVRRPLRLRRPLGLRRAPVLEHRARRKREGSANVLRRRTEKVSVQMRA